MQLAIRQNTLYLDFNLKTKHAQHAGKEANMQKSNPTRVKILASVLGLLVVAEICLEVFVYPHIT